MMTHCRLEPFIAVVMLRACVVDYYDKMLDSFCGSPLRLVIMSRVTMCLTLQFTQTLSCIYSISTALRFFLYSQGCFTPQPMALYLQRFPDADPFEAGEKELMNSEK